VVKRKAVYAEYQESFKKNQLNHEDKVMIDRDMSNGSNTFLPMLLNNKMRFSLVLLKGWVGVSMIEDG
jgi:hypothetical protein